MSEELLFEYRYLAALGDGQFCRWHIDMHGISVEDPKADGEPSVPVAHGWDDSEADPML
jgi:hypothetical protein